MPSTQDMTYWVSYLLMTQNDSSNLSNATPLEEQPVQSIGQPKLAAALAFLGDRYCLAKNSSHPGILGDGRSVLDKWREARHRSVA